MAKNESSKQAITLVNEAYEIDESKTPMWYVFTSEVELDGNLEVATIVIGPSTEETPVVVEYVREQVASDFKYRGGFDHEPEEEELSQFLPEGYEEISRVV